MLRGARWEEWPVSLAWEAVPSPFWSQSYPPMGSELAITRQDKTRGAAALSAHWSAGNKGTGPV